MIHPSGYSGSNLKFKEKGKSSSTDNRINDVLINLEQVHHIGNQRDQDRRSKLSQGFIYISTIGWIDRRERLRRKDDPYKF